MSVRMENLQPGKIVQVTEFPEPSKPVGKARKVLVVSLRPEIASSEVVAVGITTLQRPDDENENWIRIHHREDGTATTGLTRPSVIVCDWVHTVPFANVVKVVGKCPPWILQAAIDRIQFLLGSSTFDSPLAPNPSVRSTDTTDPHAAGSESNPDH